MELNLANDQLLIEKDGMKILVESYDAFAILNYHPLLAKRIMKEFCDETTLGDIIFLTQSLGFEVETRTVEEE